MRKASDDFDQQRERARRIEMALSLWLKRRGYKVLPTYDYSGQQDNKAPKLESLQPEHSLVVPDLFCIKRGRIRWVEVKLKSEAPMYRKLNRRQTGFSRRLWDHYNKVQEESGAEVILVFVHEKEREVRAARLDTLKTMLQQWESRTMGDMVYFPYDSLTLVATLDELQLTSQEEALCA